MRRRRRQAGFFVLDAVVALGVLMMLTLMVGAAMSRSARGTAVLADTRAATRIAERILAGEDPAALAGATVESTPAGDGWVAVTVRYGDAAATLVGREAAP